MKINTKIKKTQVGFTLIELIMVVAIIGMLAFNIIVVLGGTREKVRMAAALRLSSSIAHGLEPVGIWGFDDGSASDGSGVGNNGVLKDWDITNGDGNMPPQPVNGVRAKALSFDGIDDYIELPSINPQDQITVEAWIKSASPNTYGGIWQVVSKYISYLMGSMSLAPKQICFITHSTVSVGDSNWRYGTCYEPADITQWHHFVGTYDSATGTTRLYVDGEQKDINTPLTYDSWPFNPALLPAKIDNDTNPIHVGHRECEPSCSNGQFFQGSIDDVRIYDRALTVAEIQKRYAESAPAHPLVTK